MADPYLAASEVTRLTRWWPRVCDAGVPVPQTALYPLPSGAVFALFDGQDPGPALDPAAIAQWITDSGLAYPLFLRTDILSAKHSWCDTCYVAHPDQLTLHVGRLLEASLESFLEPQALVAREFLDLDTRFNAFHGALPIGAERRYFIRDGRVICHHPYWPADAIEQATTASRLPVGWHATLATLNREEPDEVALLTAYATTVAHCLPGAWSVDFARLRTGGWVYLDSAIADISWHPPCPEEPLFHGLPIPAL